MGVSDRPYFRPPDPDFRGLDPESEGQDPNLTPKMTHFGTLLGGIWRSRDLLALVDSP